MYWSKRWKIGGRIVSRWSPLVQVYPLQLVPNYIMIRALAHQVLAPSSPPSSVMTSPPSKLQMAVEKVFMQIIFQLYSNCDSGQVIWIQTTYYIHLRTKCWQPFNIWLQRDDLSIIVCFFRPITSSNLTNSVIVIFESILIFVICRKADPSLVEFPTEEDLQLTPSPCISPQVKLFQSSFHFFNAIIIITAYTTSTTQRHHPQSTIKSIYKHL